jgi:two-component system sensor histidine kinase UhpB
MSLRGQFFLSVALALLLCLSVLGVVALGHARTSVGNEMAKALEAGDRIVDNALLSLPREGQDLYLERLVRSFDGNRHVRVVLIERAREQAASRLAISDPAPRWYQHLLEIPVETRIDTAARLGGRALRVSTDARNEIGEAWTQFRDGAAILGLFSLVVLGLLHLAVARIARPIARLGAGFEALGGGDYTAHVPVRGPREITALGDGFNRMAGRLKVLEDANRKLTGQMLAIQEEERAELARDLHDEMGPFLFTMRLDAEAIERDAQKAGLIGVAARAQGLGETLRRIQSHVRDILKQLRPEGLAQTGLKTAIANLATFWQRHHGGIAIRLDVRAEDFGAETDAVIYRLVQEGLTNAARHGGARNVLIRVTRERDAIRVAVEDDGTGLSGHHGNGMGIKGMRERLAAVGGTLRLEAHADGGTLLLAEIPCAMEPVA